MPSDAQTDRRKIQEGAVGDPTVERDLCRDIVVHAIDLTLSFLGEYTRPKTFWALGLIAHRHELKDCQDADNAVGIMGFWGRKVAYYYHLCTTAYEYDNCTEIIVAEVRNESSVEAGSVISGDGIKQGKLEAIWRSKRKEKGQKSYKDATVHDVADAIYLRRMRLFFPLIPNAELMLNVIYTSRLSLRPWLEMSIGRMTSV
ncbi:unnamed protein product [Aspergillus oryzae]|nr:unnamed protein product [Aspergillus oryzae]GMF96317.1 unnamed protein product [Aspergillus oryzae]GMG17441.1 unnamed protein product [Aspergillus oryzae]